MKTLENSQLSIKVSPHGAELCSIFCNGIEYLWQADPQFWKRHSPVLFPIVGGVCENEYRHNGKKYSLSQHGFARDMDFKILSETSDEIWFGLSDNEATRLKYPFAFNLRIGYRIEGRKIHVMWKVHNPSQETVHFQIGAHPAFFYRDYSPETGGKGYFGFDRTDRLKYILISEKGCADPETEYPLSLSGGLLPINAHTFDRDALIFENSQIREVTLYDSEKKPYISLSFDAPVVGLWSPPAKNAPFVCIEPWYGRCDRAHFSGEYKDKDWIRHLEPGEEFSAEYIISII